MPVMGSRLIVPSLNEGEGVNCNCWQHSLTHDDDDSLGFV